MGVMLIDLATACRRSGLRVVEVPGWKTRTRPGGMATRPQTIVCHHTATSDRAAGNYPTMSVVRDGRPGLPGPLAQLGLGRDGTVYVIAAGRANHAGRTRLSRQSNSCAIGIECEASGARPIEGKQLDAYVRLVAALCKHYGVPVDHVQSHGEVAVPRGRKNDIRNHMGRFRSAVAAAMVGGKAAGATPTRGSLRQQSKPVPVTGRFDADLVTLWQRYLVQAGGASIGIDGQLGPRTISAWQAYMAQKLGIKGIGKADGIAGPATARATEKALGLPAETVAGFYPGIARGLARALNEWVTTGKEIRA